tara:strand:- start:1022 stop:1288 length:267 start_codon:yes stop_codon:yes gene_type:complete
MTKENKKILDSISIWDKALIYMDYYISQLILKNWFYENTETGFLNMKYLMKDINILTFDEFLQDSTNDGYMNIYYWYPRFKDRIKIKM